MLHIKKIIILSLLLSSSFCQAGNNQTKFEPTWQSLANYKVPKWYKNAKFGIWAHWGPQCQPEHGDWYARGMYEEGSYYYKSHIKEYGHPSESGFKDIIHMWKADKWNPEID